MAHGLVLQTQADAPAGRLADWARRRRIALETVRVDQDAAYPDPRDPDFVVALGSGSTATGDGPDWVQGEIEWLRAADAAATPVLGICFGAQALAAALGGCVRRLAKPELGWVTIDTVDADRVPAGPWLSWHEDHFTLPPLAYELASNAFGVQAFCHCRHLAVQFHPEVTPRIVTDWTVNDHGDLARAGTTLEALEAGTRRHAAAAAEAADRLFDGFAARAGLVAVASRV
jgi:GMP synthase-like glutamine amidotransferase